MNKSKKESKLVPGPWKIDLEQEATFHHDKRTETVVEITNADHSATVGYAVDHEHARLIAAAPELLAVLRNATESLKVCADDSEEAGYPDRAESVRADIKAYEAVLAQATRLDGAAGMTEAEHNAFPKGRWT